MSKVDVLREIVQTVADERQTFFKIKGEGVGNLDTNQFLAEVKKRALMSFGEDHSEKRICGENNSAVDFYFPDEQTIVEIALGIQNPNTEFEKDILKALLAQERVPIQRLVLIGKPGSCKKCAQPSRQAFANWAKRHHQLQVDVYDIMNNHLATASETFITD